MIEVNTGLGVIRKAQLEVNDYLGPKIVQMCGTHIVDCNRVKSIAGYINYPEPQNIIPRNQQTKIVQETMGILDDICYQRLGLDVIADNERVVFQIRQHDSEDVEKNLAYGEKIIASHLSELDYDMADMTNEERFQEAQHDAKNYDYGVLMEMPGYLRADAIPALIWQTGTKVTVSYEPYVLTRVPGMNSLVSQYRDIMTPGTLDNDVRQAYKKLFDDVIESFATKEETPVAVCAAFAVPKDKREQFDYLLIKSKIRVAWIARTPHNIENHFSPTGLCILNNPLLLNTKTGSFLMPFIYEP